MSISYQDEEIVESYSKLAYIYDAVMYHVDYLSWSRYVQKIIRRWHPSAEKILDISSQHLYQRLIERFEAGSSDLYSIAGLLNDMQSKRTEASETLALLEQTFAGISERIAMLQDDIQFNQ